MDTQITHSTRALFDMLCICRTAGDVDHKCMLTIYAIDPSINHTHTHTHISHVYIQTHTHIHTHTRHTYIRRHTFTHIHRDTHTHTPHTYT
jgi:hypothetical protein